MIINVVFDSSTSGAPAGFFTAVNAAVDFWERELINPITVTIHFGYNEVDGQTIGNNALAESESEGISATYAQVKAGLTAAATSANDLISIANLPASDPTNGAGYFVSLAEAEVMGLFGTTNTLVGYAGLSSAFPFTFDPENRSVSGDFDAIGAMEHEISEVLGRIAGSGEVQGGVAQYSPLDLFRYVSPGQLALTPEAAYFSIDGGTHMLLPFNNPTGGNDAGDWAPSVFGDSFGEGSQGTAGLVSATDLEVMDVLGYTLAPDPNARDDFNADGKSDFLIENTSGTLLVGEVTNGQAGLSDVSAVGPEWSFRGNGDLLGDGRSDYLMENTSGLLFVGEVVNGQTTYTAVSAVGPEWKFVGIGDFLDHARDDFLMENTSGLLFVGEVTNGQAAYTPIGAVGPEWKFVGSGGFLGDGRDGFLMENTSGLVVVGEVVNGQAAYTAVSAVGPEWKFVGTGNFLGDGKTDYLMENTSGLVLVGEVVNGQAAYTAIAAVGPEWKFVGAGDYFGEGHDQFLMENTSGAVYVGDWTNSQLHLTAVTALGSEWTFH